MYEKKNKGWVKHLDFILLDLLCLQLSFIVAYVTRHGLRNPYQIEKYLNLAVVLALIDFCVIIIFESFKNVLKRGYYKEFVEVIKHVFLVIGVTLFYVFTIQSGGAYSRIFFYLLIGFYVFITYSVRQLWKKMLQKRKFPGNDRALLIIAPRSQMEEVIENLKLPVSTIYSSVKAVVADENCKGIVIKDIPIVASFEDVPEYIRTKWVDEVFITTTPDTGYPSELLEELGRMGVVVHIALTTMGKIAESKQQVERLGNYTVLTTGMNYATTMQLMIKRAMDVCGGLVGCLFTLLLTVIIGPMIYISSPGPIFFSQERVGRNGKRFKMYKFRTMYLDAEERKAELLACNRIENNLMFKVDYDPRIIGNRKMSDGTVRKGLGSFLRELSLDEFPQMFNILKGDMSLVGTRPPTVDEWEIYENHHRARLAFRPGLTGLWQVSGRSNITDFEDVVKLDTKYIDEWNLGLDIKILLKTVKSVFGKRGAM